MAIVVKAWFFEAARTSVGPPMSICSIASSQVTPFRATVVSKGYRFTTTSSKVRMPCSASDFMSSGLSWRQRMPPWTFGWRVLSRPSIISGKPVYSETSRTGMPSLSKCFAGTAGAVDFYAGSDQTAGETGQSQLVADADQAR